LVVVVEVVEALAASPLEGTVAIDVDVVGSIVVMVGEEKRVQSYQKLQQPAIYVPFKK
jgi:hypothetical protein